ncbi:hypothetical protein SAMN05216353_11843 [Halobacillus alkaliphilus]|uniref:Uncharacterized protein n=1 Tax=Halobacillus alkaliphilus TaxID=396056 RepID=A0A1I2NAY3_9BACI|nr:hypothetical protein SAMN05216353_11843 [Halobacillus alkaliphilus]
MNPQLDCFYFGETILMKIEKILTEYNPCLFVLKYDARKCGFSILPDIRRKAYLTDRGRSLTLPDDLLWQEEHLSGKHFGS